MSSDLTTNTYPASSLLGHRAPERILTIRLGAVGDVVTVLPALQALTRLWPRSHIHHLVEEGARDVVTGFPGVEKVITIPRKQLKHDLLRGRVALLQSLRTQLRQGQYDAVVDFQNLLRSALWTSFTHAPLRVVRNNWRELSPLWFNVRMRYQPELNVVHQHCALLESLVPRGTQLDIAAAPIAIDEQANAAAEQALRAAGIEGPFTLLAPGSRWVARALPDRVTARLIHVLNRRKHQLLLVGGPNERGALEKLGTELALPVNTSLALKPLAAVIARARLLVCVDSAPMHIADMLRIPMLTLFGPSSPALYGPVFAPFRSLRLERLEGQHDFRGSSEDYFSWIDEPLIERALDEVPRAA